MSRYPEIAQADGNGHSARIAGDRVPKEKSPPAGEFQKFVADIEQLITSMTPLSGKDLELAKEKLAERVEAAKESLTAVSGEIAETARRSARATNAYVHENPWQSVGIGAILGLLVGIAVSRRM